MPLRPEIAENCTVSAKRLTFSFLCGAYVFPTTSNAATRTVAYRCSHVCGMGRSKSYFSLSFVFLDVRAPTLGRDTSFTFPYPAAQADVRATRPWVATGSVLCKARQRSGFIYISLRNQSIVQPALGLSAELILNMGVAHDGASAI